MHNNDAQGFSLHWLEGLQLIQTARFELAYGERQKTVVRRKQNSGNQQFGHFIEQVVGVAEAGRRGSR
jgi:hypothetical protein